MLFTVNIDRNNMFLTWDFHHFPYEAVDQTDGISVQNDAKSSFLCPSSEGIGLEFRDFNNFLLRG